MGADSEQGKKFEQSPEYDEARDMLHRLEGLRFPHSQILELMNWKARAKTLAFQAGVESAKAQLAIDAPCPTCGREVPPPMGDGDYSCVTCGMGMREPCEHWISMLELRGTENF